MFDITVVKAMEAAGIGADVIAAYIATASAAPAAATVATAAPVKRTRPDGLVAPDSRGTVRETPCTATHPAAKVAGVAVAAGPCDRMFGDDKHSTVHGASAGGHQPYYAAKI